MASILRRSFEVFKFFQKNFASVQKIVQDGEMDSNTSNHATSSSSSTSNNTMSGSVVYPKTRKDTTVLLGFDLGTHTSCIVASREDTRQVFFERMFPSVVGYTKDAIVSDVLPGNASVFFGKDALQHRLHLELKYPLQDGKINNLSVAKDYCRFLRNQVDPERKAELKVVIGTPASADAETQENIREVAIGIFDKVIMIPEPFLAALGLREEFRLNETGYIDPVKNSIFIDIGAGTSDFCLIQGYYPTAKDQISIPFAGNALDLKFSENIKVQYPETQLSIHKIREIKERFSYAGELREGIKDKVFVDGKPQYLEFGPLLGTVCNELLDKVAECTMEMIARVPSDAVEETLQNIILTGGGSGIQNLGSELEKILRSEGYESPVVKTANADHKFHVGRGAWKAACSAREDQWQKITTPSFA